MAARRRGTTGPARAAARGPRRRQVPARRLRAWFGLLLVLVAAGVGAWVVLLPTPAPGWIGLVPGVLGLLFGLRAAAPVVVGSALAVCTATAVVPTALVSPEPKFADSSLRGNASTPGPGTEARDDELGFTVAGIKRPNRLQGAAGRWTVVTLLVSNHGRVAKDYELGDQDGYLEGEYGPDGTRVTASRTASALAGGRRAAGIAPGGRAMVQLAFPTRSGLTLAYVVLYDRHDNGGVVISLRPRRADRSEP
jgi:hypothetical protein